MFQCSSGLVLVLYSGTPVVSVSVVCVPALQCSSGPVQVLYSSGLAVLCSSDLVLVLYSICLALWYSSCRCFSSPVLALCSSGLMLQYSSARPALPWRALSCFWRALIFHPIFHPMSSWCFVKLFIINELSKLPLRLGASESTQKQPCFCKLLIVSCSKRR